MERLLFDTHCHMDDRRFNAERDQIIQAMPEQGIKHILWVGTDLDSSRIACQYAEKYPHVWFGAGFYPHDTPKMTASSLKELEMLLTHEKCLALGEIGLDYHYEGAPREMQKEALKAQLELAVSMNKPVSLHERDACGDMLEILSPFKGRLRGVMHCFSGSPGKAEQFLKLGLYISFSGVLTFKNARQAVETAAAVPHEKALIETDSPYMAPEPLRGKRNQPDYVLYVAQKLGEIWNISPQEAARQTCLNAQTLFFGQQN